MATVPQIRPADTRFTLDSLDEVAEITTGLATTLRRLASEKVAAEGRISITAEDILSVAPVALAETSCVVTAMAGD